MNILHHSRAYIMKHKYHHHLLIGLLVVAVAGTGGIYLYKKFASAATFTFTQSSTTGGWATVSTTDTAAHPGDGTNWSKYYSASTTISASASGVSLSPSSYTATDDGTFSTSTTSGSGTSLAMGRGFDPYTKLLLHADGADTNSASVFTDETGKTVTNIVGSNAQIDNDVSPQKFSQAAKFDGNGDGLSTPDSEDFNFGSGDFTIDTWVRSGDIGVFQVIYAQVGSGVSLVLGIINNKVAVWASTGGVGWDIFNATEWGTTPLSQDTWYHIALVRNGSSWKGYVDGVQVWSENYGGTLFNSSNAVNIGYYDSGGTVLFPLNGYLDEFRVSKGIARWTAIFAKPTAPYGSGAVTFSNTAITGSGAGASVGLVTTPSPVSYWKMDDSWNDSRGTNNGSAGGNATFTSVSGDYKYGTAGGTFDGDDYVLLPDLAETPNGTIEGWFNPTSNITSSSGRKPLVANWTISGGNGGPTTFLVWNDLGTGLSFGHWNGGIWYSISAGAGHTWTAGNWYHVVATWGSGGLKLYVNNVLVASSSSTYSASGQATNWTIGGTVNPNYYFTGKIDEVAIYNTALSTESIASHYNGWWYGSPSGTFESATIDLGAKANLSTLDFTSTIPAQSQTSCTASTGAGCALKFQVAANNDNSTWTYLGPDGTASTYFTSSAGSGETIHSSLSGNRYFRYKAYLATADTAYTPTLDSVTLNYTQYATSGTLSSSKYDASSSSNVIGNILWSASGTTAERTVKLQVRTAATAGGLDTAPWCGQTSCSGSTYFTTSNTSNSTLSAATDDHQWFQYKVFLDGGGDGTPTVTSVTVSYVQNAPPEAQNVTAVQNSDGTVTVGYETRDIDSVTGSATPNAVNVSLQYCTTGSCTVSSDTGWTNANTVTGNVGAGVSVETGTGTGTPWSTGKTITWTPTTDYAEQYNATQKIRIKVDDGEGANRYGYAISSGFILDTKKPTIGAGHFVIDSSTGGTTGNTLKLSASDDTNISYRVCNNNAFPTTDTQGNSCGWVAVGATSIATSTTASISSSWVFADETSAATVYIQVRDAYGNVNTDITSAVAPATPSGFLNADVSNPTAQSFGESLSWVAVPGATYYKVYSAYTASASTVPSSYTLLASPTTNIYAHTITTATTSAYWYKVVAVKANGDISNFSTLMTEGDVPDSFGTTLPDTAAPVIASLTAVNIKNTSAEINFSTDELAIMQVFYGTGSCGTSSVVPISPTPITTSYVTGHSVYITDLSPNTTYYYCARVTDVLGNIGSITPGTVTTFTTIGGPVITNVTERELTDVSALIFWNTSTSSDSKVYYATAKASVNASTPVTGTAVTVAGSDGAYQHQIGLTGLTAGSKYYYKVVSADAADAAIVSTDDNNGQYYSFVTLKDTTPPTIMGTSTPVLASDAAVIVWQTDEMATTKVDYGTTPGVYTAKGVAEDSNFSIYHVTTLSSATANVRGASGDKNTLTPETTYYYKVTSKDAANNSATSEGTFTTPKTGDVTIVAVSVVNRVVNPVDTVTPDTTAPTISNVKVSDITPFSAVVSFETSESSYATLKYGKDASYGDAASDDVWGVTHTIKLRGLTLGTEYHIKVTAHDKSGNTGTGDDRTFKTPFLSENLKDMTKIENIEQFQKEIEETIESILPSLVPPFVSKPVVSDITESGATVSFRTNIKAFPVVGFVEDGTYDTTKDNPYTGEVSDTEDKATDHKVELTGLKQNTKYHLQARAFSLPKVIGKSADITFTTKASKISGSIVERKKDSFTVVWTTDESTTSIVEYKNLKTRITERKTDDVKRTAHSMKIDNLPPGTTYEVDISGINEQGNIVEAGATLTVTTSRDVTAPIISGFKVDNALVPGRTDRIQTIVSWKTDEAANSTVYYEEGAGTAGDTKELANKNEVLDSYITAHSVILPNLKPGTIYRLKVASVDDSGNEASFGPRTVITPRQTESITDIIFKNFEDSFKFLRDI